MATRRFGDVCSCMCCSTSFVMFAPQSSALAFPFPAGCEWIGIFCFSTVIYQQAKCQTLQRWSQTESADKFRDKVSSGLVVSLPVTYAYRHIGSYHPFNVQCVHKDPEDLQAPLYICSLFSIPPSFHFTAQTCVKMNTSRTERLLTMWF